MVIQSFKGKEAERVWARRHSRTLDPTVQRAAYRKLLILDAADDIDDLRVPPGNRLEKARYDIEAERSRIATELAAITPLKSA